MKRGLLLFFIMGAMLVSGCANHAKIEMPVVERVSSQNWQGKSFRQEIFYSQPEPGLFTGGQQQKLQPISEASLSVASAEVLSGFSQFLSNQLPPNTYVVDDSTADYTVTVNMVAKDKMGPSYPDYEFWKTFFKGLATVGFGSFEYDIIADFDIEYVLKDKKNNVFSKKYSVKDAVDHDKGRFEFNDKSYVYAAELLRKHILITYSSFLKDASVSM